MRQKRAVLGREERERFLNVFNPILKSRAETGIRCALLSDARHKSNVLFPRLLSGAWNHHSSLHHKFPCPHHPALLFGQLQVNQPSQCHLHVRISDPSRPELLTTTAERDGEWTILSSSCFIWTMHKTDGILVMPGSVAGCSPRYLVDGKTQELFINLIVNSRFRFCVFLRQMQAQDQ